MAERLSQEEIDALLNLGASQPSLDAGDSEQIDSATEENAELEKDPSAIAAEQPSQPTAPPAQAWTGTQQALPARPVRKMKRSAKVEDPVNVQQAQFEAFDEEEIPSDSTNLEIILNLELEIRVELGKTTSTVQKVLEMGPGSVLELQKLNGEPVDLLVNQRPFSKGEMIVIGENFGVRVTDILSVTEIIEALQ